MKTRNILIVMVVLLPLACLAQNKKKQIATLSAQADSLQSVVFMHQQELGLLRNSLSAQADSLNLLEAKLLQLDAEKAAVEANLVSAEWQSLAKDSKLDSMDRQIKSFINEFDAQRSLREIQATKQNTLIDSLHRRIRVCNERLEILAQEKENTPSIITLKGQFLSASRGDCFHLVFRDESGQRWDFGEADNHFPFDVYRYNPTQDDFYIVEGLVGKTLTLHILSLYGIVCHSAESMDEGKRIYEKMPTIIDIKL